MRKGHRIPWEKAEKAKTILMELLDEEYFDNAPVREINQLETIIGKLEVWQNKYAE